MSNTPLNAQNIQAAARIVKGSADNCNDSLTKFRKNAELNIGYAVQWGANAVRDEERQAKLNILHDFLLQYDDCDENDWIERFETEVHGTARQLMDWTPEQSTSGLSNAVSLAHREARLSYAKILLSTGNFLFGEDWKSPLHALTF